MSTLQAVSFTGHRPSGLTAFNLSTRNVLTQILRIEIEQAIAQGATVFYSGMAMGIDLLAARQVLVVKQQYPQIRLVAVLPFDGQDERYDLKWGQLYTKLLDHADEVICLQEHYSADCFQQRNQWLVDHCDRLIAVFNGQSRSGTAQTIRMAKKAHKQVHLYTPDELGNVRQEFFNS